MSADNVSSAEQNGISFDCIMQFVKKNWKKISVFAGFSLLLTVIIFAVLYFLIPKTSVYSLELGIQLPKEKEKIIYPSKKEFSANDIISVPVLRKVYNNNNLSGKIKFDDFCQLSYHLLCAQGRFCGNICSFVKSFPVKHGMFNPGTSDIKNGNSHNYSFISC